MAASSSSSLGRKLSAYDPNCLCGVKARLCTTRESGRQFYGCQRWKDGLGCGYFVWKEDLTGLHEEKEAYMGVPGSKECSNHDLKRMMLVMQRDIQTIKLILESEAKEKLFWKRMCQGVVMFVVAALILKKL
ncbi:unnamed protein product [Cuscuta epithymum]|uniref:GRF-type domain-containing protein n=1 Tax=Cuscuta epithymum TaxID=186058 RepID=A0AAV0EC89_9ASTE|nr:unnamed protein product [Cuscuta epithymum]CAH9121377.1 unnamed protein product [Cuscuta epithymum]